MASADRSFVLEDLKTNELLAIQLDKINLTCDKVLSAALRQLLDEILFPLRLSSFHRKILFQDRLKWLHLANNGNITDEGLLNLTRMKRLEYLRLGGLGNLKRPEETLQRLEAELSDCLIEFPPYRSHEKIEE